MFKEHEGQLTEIITLLEEMKAQYGTESEWHRNARYFLHQSIDTLLSARTCVRELKGSE